MEDDILLCRDDQVMSLIYFITTHQDLRTTRYPTIRRLLNRHRLTRHPTQMVQNCLLCLPGLVERCDFLPNVRPYPLQIYFPHLTLTSGRAETNEGEGWDLAVVAEHWNCVRG